MDERRDFSEFYPSGGKATVSPPFVESALSQLAEVKGKLAAVAAVAAALSDMDPDGPEALADVKERVGELGNALEGLA